MPTENGAPQSKKKDNIAPFFRSEVNPPFLRVPPGRWKLENWYHFYKAPFLHFCTLAFRRCARSLFPFIRGLFLRKARKKGKKTGVSTEKFQ